MDRFLLHSALIAACWLLAGCSVLTLPQEETSPAMSGSDQYPVAEAKSLIHNGALLLDVRSPEEFALGHLDGAVNLPHTQVRSRIESLSKDRSRAIVVYCKSGRRAEVAQEDLMELGYTRVVNGGAISGLR